MSSTAHVRCNGSRRRWLGACVAAALLLPVGVSQAADQQGPPPQNNQQGNNQGPRRGPNQNGGPNGGPNGGGQNGGGQNGPNQNGQRPDPQAMINQFKTFAEQTNLTDEQTQKINDIVSKADDKLKSLQGQRQPGEMFQLIRDTCQQIGGVLNDDQRKSFEEKVQASQPSGGRGGPGGGQGGPGQIFAALRDDAQKLNLTDDQKAKLKDLADSTRTKLQELRGGQGGPGGQGGQGGPGGGQNGQAGQPGQGPNPQTREKFRAIMDDVQTQLKQILTADQLQQLQDVMQQNPPKGGPGGPGGRTQGNHGNGPGGGNGGNDQPPPPPPQN